MSGRVAKHRSSMACQSCRNRKVRCDIITNGTSCTNCRLDETQCVVLASRRGKHSRKSNGPGRKSASRQTIAMPSQHQLSESIPTPTASTGVETVAPEVGEVPVCVTFDEEQQLEHQGTTDNRTDDDCGGLPTPEGYSLDSSNRRTSSYPLNVANYRDSPPRQVPLLPAFLAPLPSTILDEDLEYLIRKGAFVLPDPELRTEILRSYMFSVHPFMPILEHDFLASVSNEREACVSLLLFQTVMFAGLASLDIHWIHRAGYETTKEAREVFFNRARLLYDFDVEPDSIAVLQSLLLMSWWYGRWNERRHTWHFAGLALSLAQTMGLHREPSAHNGSADARGLRKRLWWSLFIRDRLLALGTRRISRIEDSSFDVQMLTLEDFDIMPPTPGAVELDAEEVRRTALLCIELAKLCVCIGHVLSSQYTTLSTQPDVPHTTMVVPRCDADRTLRELEKCESEVGEWLREMDRNVPKSAIPPGHDDRPCCSEVHWTILNMTHLTLINVLHRTQALRPLSDTLDAQTIQESSRAKVKDAARNITKLAHSMLRRDQARFLGLPGVTALVAACLSHMMDIRSSDEDVRDASIFRFYQSMQVLQALGGIYASADSAISFIASVIRKTGIPVPEFVSSPPMAASSSDGNRHVFHHKRPGHTRQNGTQRNTNASQSARGEPNLPPANDATSEALFYLQTETSNPHDHEVIQYLGGSSSQPVDTIATEPFLEWNSSLGPGVDFQPMTFNYDFYSDAFGLLDGQPRAF